MSRALSLTGLFFHYYGQYVKRQMSYRFNFFSQAFSLVIWAAFNVTLLWVLFLKVQQIQGYTRDEVLVIFGVANAAYGFCFTFFANLLWLPGRYIADGQLDRLLIRPVNPFLQLLMEEFSAEDVVLLLTSLGLVAWALNDGGHPAGFGTWLLILAMVASGGAVYAGLLTITATLSFWMLDRVGFTSVLLNTVDHLGAYPLTIFPLPMRLVFSTLLPLGFIGFYPAQALVQSGGLQHLALITPLVACVTLGIGSLLWRIGLRRYESTGT